MARILLVSWANGKLDCYGLHTDGLGNNRSTRRRDKIFHTTEKSLTPDEKLQQEFNRWGAAGSAGELPYFVFRFRKDIGRIAKKLH